MDFEVRSGRSLELVALSEVVQPILHYLICLRGFCFESKSIPKLPRQYPWAWAPSIPQREQVKNFSVERPDDVAVFVLGEPVEAAPPEAAPPEAGPAADCVSAEEGEPICEPPCWPDCEAASPWTLDCIVWFSP